MILFLKWGSFILMVKNDKPEKRRTAIYIRVSTTEQKVDGYGLEAQEKRLKEHIENNKNLGLIFNKKLVFSDVRTGSDLNRDGFQKMMELVKSKKVDVVLVWKIDRLSRSLKHLLGTFDDFQKHNVSFISMQENIDFTGAIGNLIFNIFGAIGEFERELIKARTYEGRLMSAEMGNYTGSGKYYGYKKVLNPSGRGNLLEIVPKEKEWVQKIYHWYIYEDLGEKKIAEKLNDLEIDISKESTAKNRSWTASKVHTILTNSIYHGEFIAEKTDINRKPLPVDEWQIVEVPSCVSQLVFNLAQEARKTRKAALSQKNVYLLSGKLKDVSLGKPYSFVGAPRNKGGFSYRRKKIVVNGESQSVFEIPAKSLDDFAWGKVKEALKNPEFFIKKYLSENYGTSSEIQNLELEFSKLKKKRVGMDFEIEKIEEFGEKGIYDEEKMSRKIREGELRITEVENRIQDIEDQLKFIASRDLEIQKLKTASEKVKYNLDNLTLKQKRALCNLVIDAIYVDRKPNLNWKGKRNKWEISTKLVLRFNPNKFPIVDEGGRTQKTAVINKKASSVTENAKSGGPG